MKIQTILFGILIVFFLTGCRIASNQVASDGKYYKNVGGNSCARYDIVRTGKIKCMDVDGKFTYYQNAMSDQEVMVWKLSDVERAVQSNSYDLQQIQYNTNQSNQLNWTDFGPVPITF
tara:strand:+ start:117 stop:470 length:354 start_codon:yes stop_codon:yes gene_type:complete